MKTRLSSLVVALFFATTALRAYDFKSGDLYYNITGDNTVEVTYQYPWKSWSEDNDNYKGLTSVIIPSTIVHNAIEYSVTSIGDSAFAGCVSINSIELPESLINIGERAFFCLYDVFPSSIVIPHNVTYIGTQAFMVGDCGSRFDTITMTSPIPVQYRSFFGYSDMLCNRTDYEHCYNVKILYVPCGTIDAYTEAGWGCLPLKEQEQKPDWTISIFSEDTIKGRVEINDALSCHNNVSLSATANYGYHFTRWSDGNTDHPRSVEVTQDTTFTAEFAINQYSVTTLVNVVEGGYTIGDTIVNHGGSVTLTAIANYGYHFIYWEECFWEPFMETYLCDDYVEKTTTQENPLTIFAYRNVQITAVFAKNTYSITVQSSDNSHGTAYSSSSQAEYLDEVTLNANPEYGYHFAQWSDGNTDNPRTLILTQDTVLMAQFAPNPYTITTAVNDTERGSASGDTIANYGDYVTLTATANYGYRFDRWIVGDTYWGYFTDNPFLLQVNGDATYTAWFEKNTFSITAISTNEIQGSVNAPYSAEYLDTVILQAQPNFGYRFTQWSDGNTDNPRTFVLTQDTTFTAEFAQIYSGQCGENLYWSYANHKLSISGTGDMYDYSIWNYLTPWALFRDTIETVTLEQGITYIGNAAFYGVRQLTDIELPNSLTSIGMAAFAYCSELTKVEIPNGVTSIGIQAFTNCSKLGSASLPSTLTTIGERAFEECRKLFNIYSYAVEPPSAENNSFANYNVYLHVPCDNLQAYQTDMVFGSFKYIQCIGAENTDAGDDVTVTPSDNNAVFVWPADGSAASYTLEIRKDGVVFCTLVFNANGQLSSIAFAPARNGQTGHRAAEQTAGGFRFTVTGLTQATHYEFDMVVKDENNETLHNYTGEFTTNTPTSVSTSETDTVNDTSARKVFRNGQVYILRGGKTYTLTGEEVK